MGKNTDELLEFFEKSEEKKMNSFDNITMNFVNTSVRDAIDELYQRVGHGDREAQKEIDNLWIAAARFGRNITTLNPTPVDTGDLAKSINRNDIDG